MQKFASKSNLLLNVAPKNQTILLNDSSDVHLLNTNINQNNPDPVYNALDTV